jgi:hypothetical protein
MFQKICFRSLSKHVIVILRPFLKSTQFFVLLSKISCATSTKLSRVILKVFLASIHYHCSIFFAYIKKLAVET